MGRSGTTSADPFDVMLRPHPSSVGTARELVRSLLGVVARADLLDDAELLVSEVVTNALIHAGSEIRVRALMLEDRLRVEVSDASPHLPAPRGYGDTSGTGRGLSLLVQLVDDWGVTTAEDGKTVWFELGGASEAAAGDPGATSAGDSVVASEAARGEAGVRSRPRSSARGRRPPREEVSVALPNMPLLLHEAWREHAETLLREYLLCSLDGEPANGVRVDPEQVADNAIQAHADAMDAIALLEEQVPVADIDMDPPKLMAGATEPRLTLAHLTVAIPRASVPHFATLQRMLESAVLMVGDGRVLAPRTQPEVQAFGRWVCGQVEGQARGSSAVAWSIDRAGAGKVGGGPAPEVAGALAELTSSPERLLVGDDTNQIVGVSASAAELLGYDAPEDVVGLRLVDIIPARFHQAHIAGFTLHLLVGRSPLLDREIVAPVRRRDGSEITVDLEITALTLPGLGSCFVARFSQP